MSYDALQSGFFGWNMQAWIDAGDGSPLHECHVRDLSQMCARLETVHANTLPERFVLRLTKSGSVRHPCRVVARDFKAIDVAFS